MATWKTEIYRGEIAQTVKSEYRKLLSVNKTDCEAEKIVIKHCMSKIAADSEQEGSMWMALALREWELGRLSQQTQEKARHWASYPYSNIDIDALESLIITLESPMPQKKKIRLPSYISRCPWKVGSLLAYRIISSTHPHVTQSPFYKKYVLLRIIMIKRDPVTWLAPEAGCNESMLVGLYDWIGDAIPCPEIVENLQFTAVTVDQPSLSSDVFQLLQKDLETKVPSRSVQQFMLSATKPRIETCCSLDWRCAKGIKRDDVFTYLGCDPSFESRIDPFFKTNITEYAISHSVPFDSMLINRFQQLNEEQEIGIKGGSVCDNTPTH